MKSQVAQQTIKSEALFNLAQQHAPKLGDTVQLPWHCATSMATVLLPNEPTPFVAALRPGWWATMAQSQMVSSAKERRRPDDDAGRTKTP